MMARRFWPICADAREFVPDTAAATIVTAPAAIGRNGVRMRAA